MRSSRVSGVVPSVVVTSIGGGMGATGVFDQCCVRRKAGSALRLVERDPSCSASKANELRHTRPTARPPISCSDWLNVVAAAAARALRRAQPRDLRRGARHNAKLAAGKFAPVTIVDTEEPWFGGEKVHVPGGGARPAESGMLAAAQDTRWAACNRAPCVVGDGGARLLLKAGIGVGGAGMLTSGNANLLMAHGSELQREVFARNEFAGRASSAPCACQSRRPAPPVGHRHARRAGRAGAERSARSALPPARQQDVDQATASTSWPNIAHLVLAKIPGPDGKLVPGTRGISLFIVPKNCWSTPKGRLTGERNDVAPPV